MATRMRAVGWFEKPRAERLAAVLYPHLSDAQSQCDMLTTSQVENKRAGLERRLKAGQEKYKPTAPKQKSWWSK